MDNPGFFSRQKRLFIAETLRVRGRAGPFAAAAAVFVSAGLGAASFVLTANENEPGGLINGWACAARAASTALPAAAFSILLLASHAIAGERVQGTLRSTLSMPLKRMDVFVSKALWYTAAAVAAALAAWAVPVAIGWIVYGLGDVSESIKYGREIFFQVHHEGGEMRSIFAKAASLSIMPVVAACLLGLACSAVARKPASALAGSIAVYLGLELFLKNLWAAAAPYLFVTYTGRFSAILGEYASGLSTAAFKPAEAGLSLWTSASAALLLLSIGFIAFQARDVVE